MSAQPTKNHVDSDTSKTLELANELLTELELTLNLGPKLTQRQLIKLFNQMEQIVKNQKALPKKKIQVKFKKRVMY